MDKTVKAESFVIAFYDGMDNKCFDEDWYGAEFFDKAYEYYNLFNSSYEKGRDYAKLYAFAGKKIGFVLICDFNSSID